MTHAHPASLRRLRLGLAAVTIASALPSAAAADIERRLERTFPVTSASVIVVRISGGPIQVTTAPGTSADVRLIQTVRTDSDREADEMLDRYTIALTEEAGRITLTARRRSDLGWGRWNDRVRLSVVVTVPPNVRLDLDTSGGPITVRGERTAPLSADTSGGSITVDGGGAEMNLDTSGGHIEVGRALATLRANTSGGGIDVAYVGPDARLIEVDTSGGSIDIGVDPRAKLSVSASTSGGGVSVSGLSYSTDTIRRNSTRGAINGGGGSLRAETSGGSIRIHDARR